MIKKLITQTANKLWVLLSKKEYNNYIKNLNSVYHTQEQILLSIVERNKDSIFGREYNFSIIKNIEQYQNSVPLSEYGDYEPYINKISNGEVNILTSDPIQMFELSSGSTSASKYIPYTENLKKEFQNGLKTWVYDAFSHHKQLYRGPAYWSITPVANRSRRTPGGIPIGFEEDNEYFGFIEKFLLNFLFAVPGDVKNIDDIDNFKYTTLLFLIKQKNLSLISVWNPTFLTLLLDPFDKWKNSIIKDLNSGTITFPNKISDVKLYSKLVKKVGKNKKRAQELSLIISKNWDQQNPNYTLLWPNLTIISCWTSANAAPYIPEIKKLFPGAIIQGKGLLATEGLVSFPLTGYTESILSIRSHFYEFIEQSTENKNDKSDLIIKTADKLELNKIYSVVLTTSGGFYRYQLHDLIMVTGFIQGCPIIDFIGKEEKVSDYFGEKINESHIKLILDELFKKYNIKTTFEMVSPEMNEKKNYFYVLYIETSDDLNSKILHNLNKEFEVKLQENFHYKYCIDLGQLHKSKIFLITPGMGNKTYIDVCTSLGQRLGDIKPTVLHTKTGWSGKFPGNFIEV